MFICSSRGCREIREKRERKEVNRRSRKRTIECSALEIRPKIGGKGRMRGGTIEEKTTAKSRVDIRERFVAIGGNKVAIEGAIRIGKRGRFANRGKRSREGVWNR